MTLTELGHGSRVEINGRHYKCEGRGPQGRLKLRRDDKRSSITFLSPERLNDYILDGRARLLPPQELRDLLHPKVAPSIPADLSALADHEQAATRRRYDYVKGVYRTGLPALTAARLGPVITAVREKRGDERAPHWRTVVRWVRQYEQSQSVMALVAERRGNGHDRLGRACELLMQRTVEERYLSRARNSLKDTLIHLHVAVEKENELIDTECAIPKPSYRALRRYVGRLDKFEVMARRYGEGYARRWFRAYGKGAIATRALEIVQIDHTILDVEVAFLGVLRLGKPTITVVLDTYTRMVLGLEVTFQPASYLCVMDALCTSILPKDALMAPLRHSGVVRNDWPAFGVPELLLVDNGREFRGHDLKNACAHLGMDIRYCPPRSPWFKGAVERFLLSLKNSLIAQLPSRTFPIKEEQGDREPDGYAIDLDDLRAVLVKWVVDVYHESPHGMNGLTPRAMWEQATRGERWF